MFTNRDNALDYLTFWYSGKNTDMCDGFRTSTSDARVAFVLADEARPALNPANMYECPHNPKTGKRYRWASSVEVLSLGSIFNGAGVAGSWVYSEVCGRSGDIFNGERSAFMFSDTAARDVYVDANDDERATLHSSSNPVAGLVCILDEPSANCSTLCNSDQPGVCPTRDHTFMPQKSYVPQNESINLLVKFIMDASNDAPRLEGFLGAPNSDYNAALQKGTYALNLSLDIEPASWVRVMISASTAERYVTWETPEMWFGGHRNSSWDTDIYGLKARPFNEEQSIRITCLEDEDWSMEDTITMTLTLVSTVPSYNGQRYMVHFKRYPRDFRLVPLDRLNDPAIVRVRPPERETVVPETDYGEFCVRAGAQWSVPGEKEDLNYATGKMLYCGRKIKQVAAGGYHSCAVADDINQYLFCWGRNDYNQTVIPSGYEQNISKVTLGSYHTCAVKADGQALCWGDDGRGQCQVPSQGPWLDISAGAAHTCGLKQDGSVLCWGDTLYGQDDVPAGVAFANISAGFFHTCGVSINRQMLCWGAGKGANQYKFGQTVPPDMGSNWTAVSCGNLHSCGLLRNGSLYCWGSNSFGQARPPTLDAGVTWLNFSAGLMHTCGVTSNGQALCWGSASRNRLYVMPHQKQVLWKSVSSGSEHTCGVLASGRISCWGFNTYEQLAVSAMPYVRFDVANSTVLTPGLDGLRNAVPSKSLHISYVTMGITVPNPPPSKISYYVKETGDSFTELAPAVNELTFDISVSVVAYAMSGSNDPEYSRGDNASKIVEVKVATPEITLSKNGTIVLETNATLSVDKLKGSKHLTKIYYTMDDSIPTEQSPEYPDSPLLLDASTGNATGWTIIRARAYRQGASTSDIANLSVLITASTVNFSVTTGSIITNDAGQTLTLKTSGNAKIMYRMCRLSSCNDVTKLPFILYSSPLLINETGTFVSAKATASGLADGPEAVHQYFLQATEPNFSPNPNTYGFLSPQVIEITCAGGSAVNYNLLDGRSGVNASGNTSIELVARDNITAWCSKQGFSDSVRLSREYRVGPVAVLRSTITESTNVASIRNLLTVEISTTRPLRQNGTITLSGLTGSQTPDNPALPISNPLLSATWSRSSGTLILTVKNSPPASSVLFAVTNATSCAERLPFGPSEIPATSTAAYFSTTHRDMIHGSWRQQFFRNGVNVMTIEYTFRTQPRSLRERMISLATTGEQVQWKVWTQSPTTASPNYEFWGSYRFSSTAGFTATSPWSTKGPGLSVDDGVWGALDSASGLAELDGHGSTIREGSFWGQGVFDSSDAASCSFLYFGSAMQGVNDSSLVSRLYLTDLYSDLAFSFTLVNPPTPRIPVSPVVSVTGAFCPTCPVTNIPPQFVNGTVLGSQVAFAFNASLSLGPGSRGTAGFPNTINVNLKSNMKFPPSGPNTTTMVVISGLKSGSLLSLTPSSDALPVGFGGKTVLEASAVFMCRGYQSCAVSVRDYLPAGATLIDATLSVDLACSDFNAPEEFVEWVTIDGTYVSEAAQGPWADCENNCNSYKPLFTQLSLKDRTSLWSSKLTGGLPFDVRLQASQGVDSHSCSETSREYVKARATLLIRYRFTGAWDRGAGTLTFLIQPGNQQQDCEEETDWRDAGGYSCQEYTQYKWCARDSTACGGISGSGLAWACEQFAIDGVNARDVCCSCGGGSRFFTRMSFVLQNPSTVTSAPISPTIQLSVTENGAVTPGYSYMHQLHPALVGGALAVCSDGSTTCLIDPSLQTTLSGSSTQAGPSRRLLQMSSLGDQSSAMATFRLDWTQERQWLYTCCWDDMSKMLAKGVADTVGGVDYRNDVTVTFSNKADTSVTAAVAIMTSSDDAAVIVANNMRDKRNIETALMSQRLYMTVTLQGSVSAYNVNGTSLQLSKVMLVGNTSIGPRYLANQAAYPTETLAAYDQRWDIGRVLLNHSVALGSSGFVSFSQTVVHKACVGYRLLFSMDADRTALSMPFLVRSGSAAALRVSPVPTTLPRDQPMCSCAGSNRCVDTCACVSPLFASACAGNQTVVVAGLYFSVTATLVDAYNNVVRDYPGDSNGFITVRNLNESVPVYGAEGEAAKTTMQEGVVVLTLTLRRASDSNRLEYTHVNTMSSLRFKDTSQTFTVRSGAIARLYMRAPAFNVPLIAGEIIYPAPEILVRDAFNNSSPYNTSVSAFLLNDPGILKGPQLNVGALQGEALFQELVIEKSGVYAFVASADGFDVISPRFTVLPAVVNPAKGEGSLEVAIQPAGALAGEVFTVQPAVRLLDRFGNIATTFKGFAEASLLTIGGGTLALGNTSLAFDHGVAVFTDLRVDTPRQDWRITFQVGRLINVTSAAFPVMPRLASMRMLQEPPLSAERACMDPPVRVLMLDAEGTPSDFSRQHVTVAFSENTFRYTQYATCGTGGCTASKVFRFYVPEAAELVSAFMDVQVIKTDFDDLNEEVEFISVNGLPIMRHCDPGEAAQCENYFACLTAANVTELAYGNVLSVSVKISEAVNEHCSPRLTARIDLYGSYRPQVPEFYTLTQDGAKKYIEGTTQLQITGRTLTFNHLIFPVQGLGYRLILRSSNGVSVETDRFTVLAVASTLAVAEGQQPGRAIANELLGIQPMILFLDARGKLVTTVTSSVRVDVLSAQDSTPSGQQCVVADAQGCWQDAPGVVLQGTTTVTAVGGKVRFYDLKFNAKADKIILRFSSACTGSVCANLGDIKSDPFRVEPPATNITIMWDAPRIMPAGRTFPLPPSVWLLSPAGALAILSVREVNVVARNNATGRSFPPVGDTVVRAAGGVARFSNLSFVATGVYSLVFSFLPDTPMLAVSTAFFTVVPGSPARIVPQKFLGVPFVAADFTLVVQLHDEFGNLVVEDTSADVDVSADVDIFENRGGGAITIVQSLVRLFTAGVAEVTTRVEDITLVNFTMCTLLSPYKNCNTSSTSSFGSSVAACDPRSAYPTCPNNVRASRDSCTECVVRAYQSVQTGTNPSFGALKIVIEQYPGGASDGQALRTQPVVILQQCTPRGCAPVGNLDITASIDTVQEASGPMGLQGNVQARAGSVNGRAVFTDLTMTGSATWVTLIFSLGNMTNASSVPFSVRLYAFMCMCTQHAHGLICAFLGTLYRL